MEDTVVRCPRCAAEVAFGEKFCAACGTAVIGAAAAVPVIDDAVLEPPGAVAQDPVPMAAPRIDLDAKRKLGNARKWLVAMSVISLLSGLVLFAINRSDIEQQIRDADAQTAGIDPATRDALMMKTVHLTWDEAVRHDRGMVYVALVSNMLLAAAFFGLWLWAKRNVLAASVTALLLFITVTVVNAVYEPKLLGQGVVVKILFVVALAKAISVAQQERKLAA